MRRYAVPQRRRRILVSLGGAPRDADPHLGTARRRLVEAEDSSVGFTSPDHALARRRRARARHARARHARAPPTRPTRCAS
jgi:hypothetical protein